MKQDDNNIFELQGEACKASANPKRLEIIGVLKNSDELTINRIVDALRIPKYSVSHNLSFMRSTGILTCREECFNV